MALASVLSLPSLPLLPAQLATTYGPVMLRLWALVEDPAWPDRRRPPGPVAGSLPLPLPPLCVLPAFGILLLLRM